MKRWLCRGGLALFILVFALGVAAPAFLTSRNEEALEEVSQYVQEELDAVGVPGAALAVVRGDDIALLETFGVADRGGRPVTPETPFVIGSLTKSFTGLAVMQLAERGKLELDAPVRNYLPYFALDDGRAGDVTLRHALNHTTGITWWDGLGFEGSEDRTPDALENRVRALKEVRLARPPGETFV